MSKKCYKYLSGTWESGLNKAINLGVTNVCSKYHENQ